MYFRITVTRIDSPHHVVVFEKAGIYQDKYRFIITCNHKEHTFNRENIKCILIERME